MLHRREHQVAVSAAVAEATRLLNDVTDSDAGQRVDALLQSISTTHADECRRLGVVNGGTIGSPLVDPKTLEPIPIDRLVGPDGAARSIDAGGVVLDPVTGLLGAAPEARMLNANRNQAIVVPRDFVLHPRTGKMVPIDGSVAFDPITARIVFTADNGSADAAVPQEPLIPYVPYPVDPRTDHPVATTLRTLEKRSDMHYNHPMADHASGQHVPILAVTIHPDGDTLLPVGGVHNDPVTGLPIPIEIGGMMRDVASDSIVPIVGVRIDATTGRVVPIGGCASQGKPILLGDVARDSYSGEQVVVTGAHGAEATPCGGGFESLLDANELACEERVVECLNSFKRVMTESRGGGAGTAFGIHAEEAALEEAMTQLAKCRTATKRRLVERSLNLRRRRATALALRETGGSPGSMEFVATGQLLPLLVGTKMSDPGGSTQQVPILGVDRDRETSALIPLGGTMEDPHGGGLVPIELGRLAVDAVSGEISPVCGVRIDAETRTVVPVTLSSSSKSSRMKSRGFASDDALDSDAVARRSYWRRQRQKADELIAEETTMMRRLLESEYEIDLTTVRDGLDAVADLTRQLETATATETRRRVDVATESVPAEVIAMVTEYDAEERELESLHVASHARFAAAVRRFIAKAKEENSKYETHMSQLALAHNAEGEAVARTQHRQLLDRLRGELSERLVSRIGALDRERATLDFVRELADLCVGLAKGVVRGSLPLAGDYDTSPAGYYEMDLSSDGSSRELVPLLEKLIGLIESGGMASVSGLTPSKSMQSKLNINK